MTPPTTRPSELLRLLEDTPEGNKLFKEYVIDTLSQVRDRLTELEDMQPAVTSSVNDYNGKKQQITGAGMLIAGLVSVSAVGWAVIQACIQVIKWIKGAP